MIRHLLEQVPGQHVGLQADSGQHFYASLGFKCQPEFWSIVAGTWLDNTANRERTLGRSPLGGHSGTLAQARLLRPFFTAS